MTVLVGIVDSGVAPELGASVAATCSFAAGPAGNVLRGEAAADRLGHGTAIVRVILEAAPEARIVSAQVFHDRMVAAPAIVAAGLRWLTEMGCHLVNLSFGVAADRQLLRDACDAAGRAGAILVAAAPARGAPAYPASYLGVIRVSGDARCGPGEISSLGGEPADFGACPRGADGKLLGASIAAARITGILAARPPASTAAPREWLHAAAAYRGREQKGVGSLFHSVRRTSER
ncbi:MAG: hypothetical protein QOD06_2771 [Candidatus Binatota bacterium]|nr:hypothetical protein [Candidatus Binatota bacterium]